MRAVSTIFRMDLKSLKKAGFYRGLRIVCKERYEIQDGENRKKVFLEESKNVYLGKFICFR